ncbi:MAG: hypothetical protein WD512_12745, partial [Candidatus Paceibacterota bacterium]
MNIELYIPNFTHVGEFVLTTFSVGLIVISVSGIIKSHFKSTYGVSWNVYTYSMMSRKDISTLVKSSKYGDPEFKIAKCNELILQHYKVLENGRYYLLLDDFIVWCVKNEFYTSVCKFHQEIHYSLAKKILPIIKKYDPATHPDIGKLLEIVIDIIARDTNNSCEFSFDELVDLIIRTSQFNSHIWGAIKIMIRTDSTYIHSRTGGGLQPYQIYLEKNLPYDPEFLCLLKDLPTNKLQLTSGCYFIYPQTLEKMIELGFNPNNKLLNQYLSKGKGRRLLHIIRNYY